MSRKRSLPISDPGSQLVEIYEDLSSLDEKVRLAAAHTLIVKHVQTCASSNEDITRVLRRLIRGVCSGRKAARIGFSIALAESLSVIITDPARAGFRANLPSVLLQILVEQTQVNVQSTKQEERDLFHGQLFGITALIRSGVFFHEDDRQTDIWAKTIDFVLELASRKSWLREECGFMLFLLVEDGILPPESTQYAAILVQRLQVKQWLHTPEGVAIWLALCKRYPQVLLPGHVWHHRNPLDRKEKDRLSEILGGVYGTDGASAESALNTSQGRWSPTIHFAWQAVISHTLSTGVESGLAQKKQSKTLPFKSLWETAVDANFFSPKSSQEKKLKGFLLLQYSVEKVPSEEIPTLFSTNFLQCFTNHLAHTDRYLYRVCKATLKAIFRRSFEDPTAFLPTLQGLISGLCGFHDLESRIKNINLEALLLNGAKTNPSGTVSLLKATLSQCVDQSDLSIEQSTIAKVLAACFRRLSQNTQRDEQTQDFVEQTLVLLASWAYSDGTVHSPDGITTITPTLHPSQAQIHTRIVSCFTHLLGRKLECASVITRFFLSLESTVPVPKLLRAQAHLDQSSITTFQNALSILARAKEASYQRVQENLIQQAIVVLLGMVMLTLIGGDPDASDILEDLTQTFNGSNSLAETLSEVSALVQILLGLISKPSLLLRRTVSQVFLTITHHLDEAALQSLLDILCSHEGAAGQALLFDVRHEDDDVLEGSLTENSDSETTDTRNLEEDSDFSIQQQQMQSRDKQNSSRELISNDLHQTTDEEETDEELADFERKLADALGTRPIGVKDNNSDQSSSGDELGDEQMEVIDQSLQSMFKERKLAHDRRRTQRAAKALIVNFKARVLELLEIYIRSEPDNPRTLSLILPLLVMIRTTSNQLLSRKGCDAIKLYFHICKGEKLLKLADIDLAFETLGLIHSEVRKPASNNHLQACSHASLLLSRVLASNDRKHLRRIIEQYSKTQIETLLDPNLRYKITFFVDWLNWSQSLK